MMMKLHTLINKLIELGDLEVKSIEAYGNLDEKNRVFVADNRLYIL
jgi:hypothetical protein